MEVSADTRKAVFEGAGRCQSKRRRVILHDSYGGRPAVEAAFAEWRDEWGEEPQVKLLFTATDLPIFDYVGD
jgi:hypothetical protein